MGIVLGRRGMSISPSPAPIAPLATRVTSIPDRIAAAIWRANALTDRLSSRPDSLQTAPVPTLTTIRLAAERIFCRVDVAAMG